MSALLTSGQKELEFGEWRGVLTSDANCLSGLVLAILDRTKVGFRKKPEIADRLLPHTSKLVFPAVTYSY